MKSYKLDSKEFLPTRSGYLLVLALFLTLFIPACSTTSHTTSHTPDTELQKFDLKHKDHPLAGKIWDIRNQKFITSDTLLEQAIKSDYLLLGETHDNKYHHAKQAWVIDNLPKGKNNGIRVAFEMIDNLQYERFKDSAPQSSEQLISELKKEKVGWEYKKFYLPVFDSVIKAGYKILPANLDRLSLMKIIREGRNNIPEHLKKQIDTSPLSKEQKQGLKHEIEQSHCGMINDKMTDAMMLGQNVRDATMSDSMMKNKADSSTIVLISGSGHARNDRGVPHYLKQDTNNKATSIAWLEVVPQATQIKDYAAHWGNDKLPFDYAWFTPMADRPDPCEEMKKHMKNHTKKQQDQTKKNPHERQKPTPRQQAI